jgi:WD40 repeat protein
VRVWDIQTGQCKNTLQGYTSLVHAVAISLDGSTIIFGSHETMRIWDVKSCTSVTILQKYQGIVYAVAISSDEAIVISGSDDNNIRVWNLKTGLCEQTLQGHTTDVKALTIHKLCF